MHTHTQQRCTNQPTDRPIPCAYLSLGDAINGVPTLESIKQFKLILYKDLSGV